MYRHACLETRNVLRTALGTSYRETLGVFLEHVVANITPEIYLRRVVFVHVFSSHKIYSINIKTNAKTY